MPETIRHDTDMLVTMRDIIMRVTMVGIMDGITAPASIVAILAICTATPMVSEVVDEALASKAAALVSACVSK